MVIKVDFSCIRQSIRNTRMNDGKNFIRQNETFPEKQIKRKQLSLNYPQEKRKMAQERRDKNRKAFDEEFTNDRLVEGRWYLYSNGRRIAEASTKDELLSLPECSASYPSAFHAVRIPDPIEKVYFFGSAFFREFDKDEKTQNP